MTKTIITLAIIVSTKVLFGQKVDPMKEFLRLSQKADSLYDAKDYNASGLFYSAAFKYASSGNTRYNAACAWALANNPDSAFSQLNLISKYYVNYKYISTDSDFVSLYKDQRWKPFLEVIKQNKEKSEANLNKPLVSELDNILDEDQKYRQQMDEVEKKYGWESNEMKALWKKASQADSINLIKVKTILDKYGWLGPDVIGVQGNSTLFLVIQHSDQKTQEKYLPMMKEAVKNKKAYGNDLALLEDRVLLGQGKRQIYGSQIGRDPETQTYYVSPLEDPDNVDKRRAKVGLGPLADYISHWQLKWDAEQYKKDLPALEAKERAKRQ
jgi:hypothetical protein